MTTTSSRFFDEVAKLMNSAAGAAQGVRREIDIEFDGDFDTGDLKMKGVFRLATGHGDWRGTFGSQGA